MHNRFGMRIVSLLIFFSAILTTSGVYGIWIYYLSGSANLPAQSDKSQLNIQLGFSNFDWVGEDILPDNVQGEQHAVLIENILNHEEAGLNTPDSALNTAVNTRNDRFNQTTFGSMDQGWLSNIFGGADGNDVKEQLGLTGDAANLEFMLEWVEEDGIEYTYIYTTNIDLGTAGESGFLGLYNETPGVMNIPSNEMVYEIFRTKVELIDGLWTATETVVGSAPSVWYTESRYVATGTSTATQIPSFDTTKFVEGSLGTNFTDAIWTYAGYSGYTYPASSNTPVYYRLNGRNHASGTTYQISVTSTNPFAKVNLYDKDKNTIELGNATPVEAGTDADGNQLYTLTYTYTYTYGTNETDANKFFYFTVQGDLNIKLDVTTVSATS
ncbi:MAG: hypothetical protein IJW92_04955 [Clostridia bacterium]|nr:hypothetical protein [Clostridia bacterium]